MATHSSILAWRIPWTEEPSGLQAGSGGPTCRVDKVCRGSPWTVAHQAPLSMGFPRPGYWSGLPFPSPGDLPNPGIEPRSLALQADSLPSVPAGKLISLNGILEVQIKLLNA